MRSRNVAGPLFSRGRAAIAGRLRSALASFSLALLLACSNASAEVIAGASDDGFEGFASTGAPMAHPDIAVGPDHLVAVVNGRLAVFSEGGAVLSDVPLGGAGGLWTPVGGTAAIQDPSVMYDARSGRYFAAAVERGAGERQYIYFARSNSTDPTQGWQTNRIDVTSLGRGIAFSRLAADDLTVTVLAEFTQGAFMEVWAWFDRSRIDSGDLNPRGYIFQQDAGRRHFGAVSSIGRSETFLVACPDSLSRRVEIRAIRGALTWRSSVTRGVDLSEAILIPPDADQPGAPQSLDTGGRRITAAAIAGDSLWTAHAVGQNGRSVIRWYEIRLNGWPTNSQSPSIRQTGVIDLGPGAHAWLPDIAVDELGNAVIVFLTSSSAQRVSVARAVRHADDTLHTFRSPVLIRTSLTNDPDSVWDTIVGVQPDPANPGVFWSHAPYRNLADWQTWISRIEIADEGGPTNVDLDSPGNGFIYRIDFAFIWNFVDLATGYDIEVSASPSFASAVHRATNLSETSYTIPDGVLECNTRYYWRVVAHTPSGDIASNPDYLWFERPFREDANRDGIVNSSDLGLLLAHYGSTAPTNADVNADGVVNTADLGMILQAFGRVCE